MNVSETKKEDAMRLDLGIANAIGLMFVYGIVKLEGFGGGVDVEAGVLESVLVFAYFIQSLCIRTMDLAVEL